MDGWGAALFGDPCRGCGFAWDAEAAELLVLVRELPRRYAALLEGCDGSERCPELRWSVVEYVCRAADNLRIWAERLVGAAIDRGREVVAYDNDALAAARHYRSISLGAARWSFEHAARQWLEAVEIAEAAGTRLAHPERGVLGVLDVMRSNAHDAFHHRWDLERIVSLR